MGGPQASPGRGETTTAHPSHSLSPAPEVRVCLLAEQGVSLTLSKSRAVTAGRTGRVASGQRGPGGLQQGLQWLLLTVGSRLTCGLTPQFMVSRLASWSHTSLRGLTPRFVVSHLVSWVHTSLCGFTPCLVCSRLAWWVHASLGGFSPQLVGSHLTWWSHASLGGFMPHLWSHTSLHGLTPHLVGSCLTWWVHASLCGFTPHFMDSCLTSWIHASPPVFSYLTSWFHCTSLNCIRDLCLLF